jgi:signal transduction histidine kinase
MLHQDISSELLARLLERIDLPAIVYGLDGTLHFVNAAAGTLLAPDAAEVAPGLDDARVPGSHAAWRACLGRVASGESAAERVEIHDAPRDTSFACRLFRIGEHVLAVFQDTTAEHRARVTRDRLMSLAEALSGSMSTDEMVRAVLTTGLELFHADTATVAQIDEDGAHLRVLQSVGIPSEQLEPYHRVPLTAPLPGCDVARTGEPIFLADRDEMLRRYPHLADVARRSGRQAHAILPLRVQDTVYGIITFGFAGPRAFTAADRAALTTVARQCALVVERDRLRARASAAQELQQAQLLRTRALAEASRVFAEAAAERQPVKRLCELLIERVLLLLSSGCAVRLLRDDGQLEVVAWDAPPTRYRERIAAMLTGPQRADQGLNGRVLAENRLVFLSDLDALRAALPPAHVELLMEMGLQGVITAPLRADGRPIGTISIGRSREFDDSPFTAEHAALVQELTDRAGLAIAAIRTREAAEAGMARARRLYNLTTRLSQAFTVAEVLAVTIEETRSALDAAAALVVMFDDDHAVLRVVHASGYPGDFLSQVRPIPLDAPSVVAYAVRTRSPLFLETREQLAAQFPALLPLAVQGGFGAGASFPLIGQSGVVGALGINHIEPHVFTESERELLLAISAAAGQALERASLYEREQRARRDQERASARLSRMHAIAAALVSAVTEADVAHILVREGGAALAARCGVVRVPRPGGDLELIGASGLPAELLERGRHVPAAAELPVCTAYRTGAPVWLERRSQRPPPDSAGGATVPGADHAAVAAIPLSVDGRVVGALAFGFAEERTFSTEDRELTLTLGSLAAAALERVRLYHEAQAAREIAEAASQAKDEFLAMLGHELRNPLAPIATALQLMDMRHGDIARQERAVIARQVSHLTRLVGDLLDISRITRGKIDLHRAPIEAARLVATAVERVSPLLEERQHVLEIDVPAEGLVVDGDEDRLSQVLTNLLTNAARYTDRGGRIAVRGQKIGHAVEIAVRDNGMGIDPQLLPRVFDLFVQGARTIDRRDGGLGLGLVLVKRLVELHGGTVAAHSEGSGRGSVFTVRLPLAAPDGAAGAPKPDSGRMPALAQPGQAVRVLVVDDNQDAALLTLQALEAHGYQARIAFDGPAAIKEARAFQPDVALLDIGLPVMDGYETARQLRRQPGGEALKLVALTGYGQESDRQRSREAGFDEHLTKPVSLGRLIAAVARLTKP